MIGSISVYDVLLVLAVLIIRSIQSCDGERGRCLIPKFNEQEYSEAPVNISVTNTTYTTTPTGDTDGRGD